MKVTILRGPSGSGKTTFRRGQQSSAISADDFFMVNGEYVFDPSKLGEAHAHCFQVFHEHLKAGRSVLVDNTFLQAWEVSPYITLAHSYAAEVELVQFFGEPEALYQRVCQRKVGAKLTLEQIEAQVARYEPLPPPLASQCVARRG